MLRVIILSLFALLACTEARAHVGVHGLLGAHSFTLPENSDVAQAIARWRETKITHYKYTIHYTIRGCDWITAVVEVRDGVVQENVETLKQQDCPEVREELRDLLVARSVDQLFTEVIEYEHTNSIDDTVPNMVTYHPVFGYPTGLGANFVSSHPVDSDEESPDYEYRIESLQMQRASSASPDGDRKPE